MNPQPINQSIDQSITKVPYFWNDSHVDTPIFRAAVYQCKSAPLSFDQALTTLETLASRYGNNQSINPSSSQSTEQSTEQSTNQSTNQSTGPLDLIVFPEIWLCGYDMSLRDARPLSISLASNKMNRIREIACKYEIALSFGYAERHDPSINQSDLDRDDYSGPLYNSSVTIDVDGSIAHNYRKCHLWQDGEQSCFASGSELSSFTLINHPRHRFGVQICYDIEFPEPARELALQGVSILIVHTALSNHDQDNIVPTCVLPTRAVDNHMFVLYSNFVSRRDLPPINQPINQPTDQTSNQPINQPVPDPDDVITMCGMSAILGPDGRSLARASRDHSQLLIADLQPARYVLNFHRTPFLPARRPDLWKLTGASRTYDYQPMTRAQIQQAIKESKHRHADPNVKIIDLD